MAAENQDMGETVSTGVTAGVGSLLRETRERRGQDLGFVANALRIRQPYLQAIEEGRSEDLPGSTYAVGFVRGYAEYLGLDSKEIVRRFRQENGEFSNRAELVFPSAVSEGSIPTGALLGFAIIAAAAAYGAWYWYQSREPSIASAVPALPERLAALIHQPVGSGSELLPVDSSKVNEVPQPPSAAPSPAAVPAFPTIAPSSTAASSTGAGQASAAHEDVVPPAEEGAVESSPPAAAPASPPADAAVTPASPVPPSVASGETAVTPDAGKPIRDAKGKAKGKDAKADAAKTPANPLADASSSPSPVATADDGKPAETPVTVAPSSRVVLKAKEDCWIEIRDANGKVVQNRLLKKGESYSAPSRPGLRMTVGNAGALSLVVDGKVTGSLGRLGMVRRDVPLDADRIKDGVEPPAEPTEPTVPADSTDGSPAGGTPGSE